MEDRILRHVCLRTVSPWATAPAAHAAPPPPSPLHTRATRLYSHPPRDTPDAGRAVVSQREFRVYSSPTTTLRLVLGRSSDSPLLNDSQGPRRASHTSYPSRLAPHHCQPRHERRVRVQVRMWPSAIHPTMSTAWIGCGHSAIHPTAQPIHERWIRTHSPLWPVPRSRSDGAPDQRANIVA